MIILKITKANREQINSIYQLEIENYSSPYNQNSLLNELFIEDSLFYCNIDLDNNVTGYIIARLILGECEIHRITVSKDYRRQGIAQNLLNCIYKICIDQTVHAVFLEVNENNRPAINFYKKNNFIQVGQRKKYYGDSDALILQKRISYVNDPIERIC